MIPKYLKCNFCGIGIAKGSKAIAPKSKWMPKTIGMCESCVNDRHDGDRLAAQRWIEEEYEKRPAS